MAKKNFACQDILEAPFYFAHSTGLGYFATFEQEITTTSKKCPCLFPASCSTLQVVNSSFGKIATTTAGFIFVQHLRGF